MKKLTDFADSHLRIFERPEPPSAIRDVYLIGICGAGMGSLAGLMQQAGYHVRGSDAGVYPPMSTRLAELNIPVYEGFDAAHLEDNPDLIIVGNACVPTHAEAAAARNMGLAQLSFPETLAHFFLKHRRSLVVAGTHGKTTTTGMLAHLLRESGKDPGFLVGGIMNGSGVSYALGQGAHFVVEGDEYDSAYFDKEPKFMHYQPTSAIVTSMEFDHADIYHDWDDYQDAFRRFVGLIGAGGLLALCGDDPGVRLLAGDTAARTVLYGLQNGSNVTATHIRPAPDGQRFTLMAERQEVADIFLPMSGRHNLLNALGACAIALDEGLGAQDLAQSFASFPGMKRRQEVLGEVSGVLVVDDFAHHPTAVRATIGGAKERWPGRRLVAVFEPRTNTSRRKAFEMPYAEAFDGADLAFLSAPPFRHNDDAAQCMDMGALIQSITARGTPTFLFSSSDALLPSLLDTVEGGDIVLVMSNGAFDGLQGRLLQGLRRN